MKSRAHPIPNSQSLTTQVAGTANHRPSGLSSKSAVLRASLSLHGLPLVQPPPGSPGSFTWPKVHAHRAQLGCRVRGACSLQDRRPSADGRPGRRWVPQGPGFHAGSVGPQTSLGRDGRSKGTNQAGPGLHDTARSGPGPDPGPTQVPPRGRAGAQPGPAGPVAHHSPPSSPLLSPSFRVSTS